MTRVAITGVGVVSPVGMDSGSFFDSLLAARSGIGTVDIAHQERLRARLAAQIRNFQIDLPKERLAQLDRYAQLALVAVREAWGQSGRPDEAHAPEARGVYFGTGLGGAGTLEKGYAALFLDNASRVHPMSVIAAMANAAAANIALDFACKGPALTYAVACASSAVAIGEAYRAIQSGAITLAIAGGSEALLTFGIMKSWEALMTLATADKERPESSCRPFALDRTGLVLGEGAGAVVLEALEHAQDRGAPILAEIVGYGLASDAAHLSRPEAEGQVRAMRAALHEAGRHGVAPADIAYINAHGTATRIGDKTETEAIKAAFGEQAYRVPISSTKAIHGHLMGAAGAVEFIAAVLALLRGTAPPTAHLWRHDPECDLDYVPLTARPLQEPRAVMSNSFAFGGTNAVLVAARAH